MDTNITGVNKEFAQYQSTKDSKSKIELLKIPKDAALPKENELVTQVELDKRIKRLYEVITELQGRVDYLEHVVEELRGQRSEDI